MQLRLELVTVPVSDVELAKAFYVDQVGFSVEQDVQVDADHRFVELLPPGSPCSIALTTGYVDSEPGSLQGVQVNVDELDEVQGERAALAVDDGVGDDPGPPGELPRCGDWRCSQGGWPRSSTGTRALTSCGVRSQPGPW